MWLRVKNEEQAYATKERFGGKGVSYHNNSWWVEIREDIKESVREFLKRFPDPKKWN